MLEEEDQVVDAEVEAVVVAEVVQGAVLDLMIPWRAIVVGCVATWPVTVPKELSHKGVAILCPLVEASRNPGKKVQDSVEEDGQFDSVG